MSFWRQPEEKDERCFVTCTGKDEQQAISKVIYTITNLMQGSFDHNSDKQASSIGRGQVQKSCKRIPVFVMFYLAVSRAQPVSSNRRAVVFALSPINTDLPALATAGKDLQRLLEQSDLDEEEMLIANGWANIVLK
ncbi:hypothetical protein Unana1_06809 [Umbelopsis nana]